MTILQTKDLKKYYGTEPNITRALDGVNFSVEQGEFVAVVGTSGSGKSTLLHMMGGLDTPTSGSVVVAEKELAKMNDEQLTIFRRRNIGFIFQNYNLVPILNVYENIVLPVELDGDTVDQKFMDEVRRERAVELSFEGFRFNDLQRWLLLTEEPYTIKTSQEFERVENEDFYKNNDPAEAEVRNFREETILKRVFGTKHYWFPLLDNDVYLYAEFPQNPGW